MKTCMLILLTFILLAFTLSACHQSSENDINSDRAIIAEQMDAIADLANTGVSTDSFFNQYLKLFIDEPTLLPPGRSAIQGYDSALAFYTNAFKNIEILNVVLEEPVILIEGEMAASRFLGTTEYRLSGQTDTLSSSSRYLDILQKQPDGKWRIAWHAWEHVDW